MDVSPRQESPVRLPIAGSPWRRLVAVLLLACAALAVAAGPAQAHNVLSRSDPKEGAELAEWPADVLLEFDQPVRRGFTQVTVTGPGGVRFDRGEPSVSRAEVRVPLTEPGPAGEYVIGYRILSSDGHPVAGKITFSLTAAGAASAATATEQPTPQPAAPVADTGGDLSAQATEAAQNGGAGMAVVWIAGALVLLGGATVVAMRRNTPFPPPTPAPSTPASDR